MRKIILDQINIDHNKLLHQLVKTRYVKRILNSFCILIISFIVRSILFSIISLIITFDNLYIDFTIQCIISIMLCTINGFFINIVDHFSDDIYKITKYAINNYSEDNFKRWKNYSVSSLLVCLFSFFYFVEINSYFLRIYLCQYAICYLYFYIQENTKIFRYFSKTELIMTKETYLPKSDFILIDKRKIPPKLLSEFDLVSKEEIKKYENEFEMI